jgi:hypothetical protein
MQLENRPRREHEANPAVHDLALAVAAPAMMSTAQADVFHYRCKGEAGLETQISQVLELHYRMQRGKYAHFGKPLKAR